MRSCRGVLAGAALLGMLVSGGCAGERDGAASEPDVSASGREEVAAWLHGEPIYVTELEELARHELLPVEQQRYDILRARLDELVYKRLFERELAERGIEQQALVAQEVGDKVRPVTDAEVREAFEALRGDLEPGATFEQWGPRLEAEMHNRRLQVRLQEFLGELKTRADYRSALSPPRIDLSVPSGEPARGPEGAPVTVVEFSDFDCPYCRSTHPAVERLLAEYGDRIRFVHRDFPLAIHERAVPAARAARCAGEQDRYWDYFERLMEDDGGLGDTDLARRAEALGLDLGAFSACLASDRYSAAIQTALIDGRAAGVSGTPTFFVNGRLLEGSQTYQTLRAVVDEELELAARSAS